MPSRAEPWTLGARWIFPGAAAPLPGGLASIQGDRIVAVEPAGTRTADFDLGNVAILPGFVNAHTHLDLSDARGKIPPSPDFVAWLRGVIEHRRGQTRDMVDAAILDGILEARALGTTLVGDIANEGCSLEPLENNLRAVVFLEVIGLPRQRARDALMKANSWLNVHLAGYESFKHRFVNAGIPFKETVRVGISPHAPYSVRRSLSRAICMEAKKRSLPIAMHVAETAQELELLDKQTGDFLRFLRSLDVWSPDGLAHSIHEPIRSLAGTKALLIHGNYLPDSISIQANHTIVYCPRTHAAFGHPPHPFREFLKRGVRVALGTDSLASNPDLDILAEARFIAARHPDVTGETLLRMLTLAGAEALGWADVTGSLTPGKSADLVVLPLPDRDDADPHRLVFESPLPVQRVMFRGEWL